MLYGIFLSFMAETLAIFFTYFIVYMVDFIQDDEMWWGYGYIYASVFSVAIFLSACFREYYMFYGGVIATRLRKTIISAMYDKCG